MNRSSGIVLVLTESYYLLIVFGSGVLLLFIQSSQPRLSPSVRAGSAHRFVCCTLPTGVISKGNTVSTQCYFIQDVFFFFRKYTSMHKRLKTILTLTICHAEKQIINHVSLSIKAWECEIQIYLFDNTKQGLGRETSSILRQQRTKASK